MKRQRTTVMNTDHMSRAMTPAITAAHTCNHTANTAHFYTVTRNAPNHSSFQFLVNVLLPHETMYSAAYDMVSCLSLSVCQFRCLSVTFVYIISKQQNISSNILYRLVDFTRTKHYDKIPRMCLNGGVLHPTPP